MALALSWKMAKRGVKILSRVARTIILGSNANTNVWYTYYGVTLNV